MNRRLHADMAVQSAAVHREVGPIAEQEDDEVHDELAMTGRGKAQVEPPLEIFPIRCCGQERFTLAVRTSTILQIKHKIADLYGMAVENQSLHLTPDPEDEGLSDDHEVAVPGVLFLVQKFDLPDPALPMDWDGEGGWPDDRNITVEEVTAEARGCLHSRRLSFNHLRSLSAAAKLSHLKLSNSMPKILFILSPKSKRSDMLRHCICDHQDMECSLRVLLLPRILVTNWASNQGRCLLGSWS